MDAPSRTASAAPAALLASLLALTCAACGEAAPVTYVSAPRSNDVAFALVADGEVIAEDGVSKGMVNKGDSIATGPEVVYPR